MLSRFRFLAAIFGALGIARAQKLTEPVQPKTGDLCYVTGSNTLECQPSGSHAWLLTKPLNNQCPRCGTLAQPLKRASWEKNTNCHVVENNLVECDSTREAYGPTSELMRCQHCSNAFYRDF